MMAELHYCAGTSHSPYLPSKGILSKRGHVCGEGENSIHAGRIYLGEEVLLEILLLYCLDLSRI